MFENHIKTDCYNFYSPYGLGDTMLFCSFKKSWDKKRDEKIAFSFEINKEL